jgi:hypothetical protein
MFAGVTESKTRVGKCGVEPLGFEELIRDELADTLTERLRLSTVGRLPMPNSVVCWQVSRATSV